MQTENDEKKITENDAKKDKKIDWNTSFNKRFDITKRKYYGQLNQSTI